MLYYIFFNAPVIPQQASIPSNCYHNIPSREQKNRFFFYAFKIVFITLEIALPVLENTISIKKKQNLFS